MQTEEIETEPPKKSASEYTEEIFDEICERMANGKGLREICEDPQMPNRSTFLRWVEHDTGRQRKYQQAREALMDWYAEDIVTIAWDTSQDTILDAKGQPKCNHEWVNRSRLKVDTLKFLMAKLHPKKYGERLPETEAQRLPDQDKRIVISWEREIVSPIHDDDGNIVSLADPKALRKRIEELEAQLAEARGEAPDQPPKLLTFDPGPLPSRMDGEIVTRLVDIIKAKVPQADQRDPLSVLDEVMSIISKALGDQYSSETEAA
jgi:hypothetical protein